MIITVAVIYCYLVRRKIKMLKHLKKIVNYRKLSNQDLSKINGGKRKKHKCRIYNNGMPTGRYRWC
ncbi:bactofencin A family cationic bacteriocin [Lactiplantibacillus plantarum]|uniref:bactofencin A family cationic bacteriocin n=1 Tax=Lactiplantibacillus plantarum TaxID=1590 RepID=UPI0038796EBD